MKGWKVFENNIIKLGYFWRFQSEKHHILTHPINLFSRFPWSSTVVLWFHKFWPFATIMIWAQGPSCERHRFLLHFTSMLRLLIHLLDEYCFLAPVLRSISGAFYFNEVHGYHCESQIRPSHSQNVVLKDPQIWEEVSVQLRRSSVVQSECTKPIASWLIDCIFHGKENSESTLFREKSDDTAEFCLHNWATVIGGAKDVFFKSFFGSSLI